VTFLFYNQRERSFFVDTPICTGIQLKGGVDVEPILEEALRVSVKEAKKGMEDGKGGPFGAAIIKDGKIIAVSANTVLANHDATAHAEINAIREASKVLGTHDLSGCILYATGFPCPMCLSAAIWANIKTIYYGCEACEAEEIGFRDDYIYRYLEDKHQNSDVLELQQFGHDVCKKLFAKYKEENKELY
jgi:guanine deaminase